MPPDGATGRVRHPAIESEERGKGVENLLKFDIFFLIFRIRLLLLRIGIPQKRDSGRSARALRTTGPAIGEGAGGSVRGGGGWGPATTPGRSPRRPRKPKTARQRSRPRDDQGNQRRPGSEAGPATTGQPRTAKRRSKPPRRPRKPRTAKRRSRPRDNRENKDDQAARQAPGTRRKNGREEQIERNIFRQQNISGLNNYHKPSKPCTEFSRC